MGGGARCSAPQKPPLRGIVELAVVLIAGCRPRLSVSIVMEVFTWKHFGFLFFPSKRKKQREASSYNKSFAMSSINCVSFGHINIFHFVCFMLVLKILWSAFAVAVINCDFGKGTNEFQVKRGPFFLAITLSLYGYYHLFIGHMLHYSLFTITITITLTWFTEFEYFYSLVASTWNAAICLGHNLGFNLGFSTCSQLFKWV